ncbi:hypothetical protein D1AOALGA4SA_7415 [Olavius algarvensis Delta 1 endosymbiont]|nr:hypothetical protein D1AOALGA4SA_7415 [Olavius algarvensis Delta 1 endosymbiont]
MKIFDAFLCELCASARDKLNVVSHEVSVSKTENRKPNTYIS